MVRYNDSEYGYSRSRVLTYEENRRRIKKRQERKERARAYYGQLGDEEAVKKAQEIALNMLDYMPRSSKDIQQRLRERGFKENVCQKVTDKLIDLHLIDDNALAQMLVRDRFRRKGVVGRVLSQELQRKGIDSNKAREVVLELDDAEIDEKCYELCMKKLRTMHVNDYDRTTRQKIYRHLASKGYSCDQINRTMRRCLEERMDENDGDN